MIIYYTGSIPPYTYSDKVAYVAFCLKSDNHIRGRIVISDRERRSLGFDNWTIKYSNAKLVFRNLKHVFILTRPCYAY